MNERSGPQARRPSGALREFLHTETAGAVVLLLAAVAALLWANSPWSSGYVDLWHRELTLGLVGWDRTADLRHWINDGLMAVFFFVIGVEIKRELVAGELRDPRRAAVPALAAVGGMVVPALLYAAVNGGQPGARGWGIPMATDIAFAVGVVAALGSRVPASLRLFLLTLAVVDDIGAIVVIAVFYATGLDVPMLALAGALLVMVAGLKWLGMRSWPLYGALGIGVWIATAASGVHATIAGVVLGLLVPAVATPSTADGDESLSVAERIEGGLHPWTSFLIVPLFALANAGVTLRRDALDAPGAGYVAVGVILGLLAGKAVGITVATWLAVRTGVGQLPEGATWSSIVGVGFVAGVGFTVSLFVAGLAFSGDAAIEDAAKIGILVASILAAVLGGLLFARLPRPQEPDVG